MSPSPKNKSVNINFASGKIPEHNILDLRALSHKTKKYEDGNTVNANPHENVKPLKTVKAVKNYEEKKFHWKPWTFSVAWKEKNGKIVAVAGFSFILLFIVLPISGIATWRKLSGAKELVYAKSLSASQTFEEAVNLGVAKDFEAAEARFVLAEEQFRDAQAELKHQTGWLFYVRKILPPLSGAKDTLEAGETLVSAAQDILKTYIVLENVDTAVTPPTEGMVAAYSTLRPAIEKLSNAEDLLKNVHIENSKIDLLKEMIPRLRNGLSEGLSLTDTLLTILGHGGKKRYLVVFQNNHEIRATGGFMGSFALVDIDQGEVKKIDIPGGGTYDAAGQFFENLMPPKPLLRLNPRWELQDANWWPDFPTSAEKIQWFYEKSGGPTVDGLLTLTPNIITDLLRITGPVEMPEYGVIVTSDNFYAITQEEAEKKPDETSTPKKFIGDFAPNLLEKVFSFRGEEFLRVIEIFLQGLQERDILVYMNDASTEQEIVNRGWGGEVKQVEGDYLMVVDTNIGGGKTDAHIDENIHMTTEILDDGRILNTVTVSRLHKGTPGAEWSGVNNWDYMRFYVPEGSKLVSASGFTEPALGDYFTPSEDAQPDEDFLRISGETLLEENTSMRISKEFGKTVFGNWVETRVGESSTATLQYLLPDVLKTSFFHPKVEYRLYAQKQSGSFDPLFIHELKPSDAWDVVWTSEPVNVPLQTDQEFVAFFESND